MFLFQYTLSYLGRMDFSCLSYIQLLATSKWTFALFTSHIILSFNGTSFIYCLSSFSLSFLSLFRSNMEIINKFKSISLSSFNSSRTRLKHFSVSFSSTFLFSFHQTTKKSRFYQINFHWTNIIEEIRIDDVHARLNASPLNIGQKAKRFLPG